MGDDERQRLAVIGYGHGRRTLAKFATIATPDTMLRWHREFTKNRERLLAGDVARAFFEDVVEQARGRRLLSDEHFTVDGTLLEAWAGQKSFRRKDQLPTPPDNPGNPTVNFHDERRSNATHESTTDPDSRLFKKAKGHEAKLAYLGEVLMENRHGFVVDASAKCG